MTGGANASVVKFTVKEKVDRSIVVEGVWDKNDEQWIDRVDCFTFLPTRASSTPDDLGRVASRW